MFINQYNASNYIYMLNDVKTAVIPAGVTVIAEDAFRRCSLEAVIFQGGDLEEIQESAFRRNLIEDVYFPPNLRRIGYAAFQDNHIETIKLNEGLTEISSYAFADNPIKMERLEMPKSMSYIGDNSFRYANIKEVNFADIDAFIEMTFECDNGLQNAETTFLIGGKEISSISIPENTKMIKWHAFRNCKTLKRIKIPKNVEIICCFAFAGCKNLTNIMFESGSKCKQIELGAFSDCPNIDFKTFNSPIYCDIAFRKQYR